MTNKATRGAIGEIRVSATDQGAWVSTSDERGAGPALLRPDDLLKLAADLIFAAVGEGAATSMQVEPSAHVPPQGEPDVGISFSLNGVRLVSGSITAEGLRALGDYLLAFSASVDAAVEVQAEASAERRKGMH